MAAGDIRAHIEPSLHAKIAEKAKQNDRTVKAEIERRLRKSLQDEDMAA